MDSVIQEIDIKTGLVMWEWHSLGHIGISESHNPAPHSSYPWDYIHINSVDPGPSGEDVLLSARNSWTLYDVDMHSGGFRWRLGDRHASFKLGSGTRFYWQHDAEFQPGGDDLGVRQRLDPAEGEAVAGPAAGPQPCRPHGDAGPSSSSTRRKTLLASSQGNHEPVSRRRHRRQLADGLRQACRTSPSSAPPAMSCSTGLSARTCRTSEPTSRPGRASPASTPSLAVQSHGAGALTVAASWNGATEVASWQVLAGASQTSLAPVASAPKSGFQTSDRGQIHARLSRRAGDSTPPAR